MSTYGLWLSAGGMKVNEHRQTLLANNMANMQTNGFKSDLAVIMQRRVASRESAKGRAFRHPVLDRMSGGLDVRQPHHDFAQGAVESTGRALDMAIDGEGFFTVSDGSETRYTRDGAFTRSAAGELVLAAGEGRWRVLDDAGNPIAIDETLGRPTVTDDGTIHQNGQVVARLGLATTEQKQSLRKVGENLFAAPEGLEMVEAHGRVVGESLEGSNFEIMSGLAEMIEASRAYQMNAALLQMQDEVTGQAVNRVGRLA